MSFEPGNVDIFLKVFNESRDKIRASEGCHYLELLNDAQHPNVFFTHSKWESESFLDKYRFSQLFKDTWAKTKPLFNEKAQAWSLESRIVL